MILPDADVEVTLDSSIQEVSGSLSYQELEDKLMHSVLEGDKDKVEDAQLIEDSMQSGLGSFTPDMMMEKLVQNYSLAEQLFGERLLRLVSSFNPDYIEKNIHIPEFQKELKQAIKRKVDDLKEKKLLDSDGNITQKGKELATFYLVMDELDNIKPRGFGDRVHKKPKQYGEKGDPRAYKKGDRYANVDIKKSIHLAIRRGHDSLRVEDLRVRERISKGSVYVVYGLDASGSMKGKKLNAAKRAGIALAYSATQEKDHVGLIVFEAEIKSSVPPTLDFRKLASSILEVSATKQTDMKTTIEASEELFPRQNNVTKHLILLTDAMPTVGDAPEKETLEAVARVREAGITVSLIGINLTPDAEEFSKNLVELGGGKFYSANTDNLDSLVLEEYHRVY